MKDKIASLKGSPVIAAYGRLLEAEMNSSDKESSDDVIERLKSSDEHKAVQRLIKETFGDDASLADLALSKLNDSIHTVEMGRHNDRVILKCDCELPPDIAMKVASEMCDISSAINGAKNCRMTIGIDKDQEVVLRYTQPTMSFGLDWKAVDEMIESLLEAKEKYGPKVTKH